MTTQFVTDTRSGLKKIDKDPEGVLDYSFDWNTNWLNGDTISASTWTVPAGITKDSDSDSGGVTTIWLSGGTAGNTYTITNRIVTAAGRTEERSVIINVKQR